MARSARLLQLEEAASPTEAEFAALRVRESGLVETERVQALIDGVTLAGEQVQDIRLGILQDGPEVNTSLMVLDLFVFFALETTIAGKLLSAITKTVLGKVLRSRAAFEWLPKSSYGRRIAATAAKISDRKLADQVLSSALRGEADARAFFAYSEKLAGLAKGGLSQDAQINAAAIGKTVREAALKGRFTTQSHLTRKDSPGVAILAAALDFASAYRMEALDRHAQFESFARLGFMTSDQLAAYTVLFTWDDLEEDLASTRDRYKLLFEAVIWSKVAGFDVMGGKLRYSGTGELEGVDTRLRQYWRDRFGEQTRTWAKAAGVSLNNPFDIVLGKYFVELATKKSPDFREALRVRRPLLTP